MSLSPQWKNFLVRMMALAIAFIAGYGACLLTLLISGVIKVAG
jgi:hypothetical protein